MKTRIFAAIVPLALAVLAAGAFYLGAADLGAGVLLASAVAVPSPEELKTLLEAYGKTFKEFSEKMAGGMGDLKARMLELEQKGGPRPVSGADANLMGDILSKVRDSLSGMRKNAGGINFELPAASISRKSAILGPVTAGDAALQYADGSSGLVLPAMRRMTIRGLMPVVPTEEGSTKYTRLLTSTDGAAAQGSAQSPDSKEGQILGESGMTFELVNAPIATIGTWIPASEQVLGDMGGLQRYIEILLSYFLNLEEERELLNGAGGVEISGLLAAASTFNRTTTADTRGDQIRRAITQLFLADVVANGIVINPQDEEALDLEKDSQGRYMLVQVNGRAWGIPVVSTNAMTLGSFLAGDFNAAVIRERQQIQIAISNSHSDFFTRKLVAIRADLREALEIWRPSAFVKGTFHQGGQPG
jgi:HK97 family phage major capsid protein